MAPLLQVRNLSVAFDTPAGVVHAVNDVSYDLEAGETLGVVGESGSGKSVHVLAMIGLIPKPPGRIVSGEVLFEGQDLLRTSEQNLRDLRGGKIGFVFQDPMTSLNPVLTVERQIVEILMRHQGIDAKAARRRAVELLEIVRIPDASRRVRQYPHQFSGGMRQRVMIAIGVACNPRLLIADEATTALDVTVQAQIIDMMKDLKARFNSTIIWITHDMGVVAGIADTVQVMYAGRIMERGPVDSIFEDPRNAYTWSLLQSLPSAERRAAGRLYQIAGEPPDLYRVADGDPFAPRNPFATSRCFKERPPLQPVAGGRADHLAAAWYDLPAALAAQRTGAP
ncbi:ABC transporter ATP-binding protein [Terrarubrum flagellatum]|uniref:ABC transporter ATP-binding protein n=1 Tax=Terrirubrum flagellatum TaxID=2895980 RepID=UPI003144DB4C